MLRYKQITLWFSVHLCLGQKVYNVLNESQGVMVHAYNVEGTSLTEWKFVTVYLEQICDTGDNILPACLPTCLSACKE